MVTHRHFHEGTDPKFQTDPSNLEHIYVAGAGGTQVPLSAVVHTRRELSPLAVFHSQSFPSTTVSFNLLPDVPLEVATSNIQRAVDELHMPENIRGSFDGNAGDFNKTSGRQPLLILGALVAMYIVLGVLYESLAHPLTTSRRCRRPASAHFLRCRSPIRR
jgi:multidrug efflux pump